ncbi:MAG: heavy metal translocating P-type ATPase [Christensenellales bacterium]|nr:heavy metal translocating P-type ATPase [Christensenellales bacterium]
MKMKKQGIRILLCAGLFAAGLAAQGAPAWVSLALFAAAYLVIGCDVLYKAVRGVLGGELINENFLMAIATVGAFAIGKYAEGVEVMLFYQIGEMFQHYAVGKSRRSIASLMDIRPDTATVRRDGELREVDAEEVAVGETLVIRPGERVPLDAVVVEGESMLDTAALTGESVPRAAAAGDTLLSGCINLTGLLTARAVKPAEESTASRILELVENASARKSRSERFITRFARVYTPLVVGLAVLLAVLPPLVTGQAFSVWLYRALSFLVVSCPCALVISVPLSFFGGIGGASRQGILVKGGNDLEALAQTDTVVFDKTGTLTHGVFAVQVVHGAGMDEETLMELAVCAESVSNHPISQSLLRAWGKRVEPERVREAREIRGGGVEAVVDGRRVLAGNARWLRENGVHFEPDGCEGTLVHVAVDGRYAGHIVIADRIKEDAGAAIQALRRAGVRRLVMLTGDKREVAERTARALGLDDVRAELLPDGKVAELERLMAGPGRGKLAFVGDGINDAPVLARADVGVAMGGLGSDAAIEAADVVLMTDEPSKLADAIGIARRTLRIAHENIVFALAVKLLVLALSALGLAGMQAAVFADVGVTVLAILNALRALRVRRAE